VLEHDLKRCDDKRIKLKNKCKAQAEEYEGMMFSLNDKIKITRSENVKLHDRVSFLERKEEEDKNKMERKVSELMERIKLLEADNKHSKDRMGKLEMEDKHSKERMGKLEDCIYSVCDKLEIEKITNEMMTNEMIALSCPDVDRQRIDKMFPVHV
jgi:predicted RNase H-like nuclease (RuvC/YqgF family)